MINIYLKKYRIYIFSVLILIFILTNILITPAFAQKEETTLLRKHLMEGTLDPTWVEFLLEMGADPNYIDNNGNMIFEYLLLVTVFRIENNSNMEEKIIKTFTIFKEYGAEINIMDTSLLYFPIANGAKDLVEFLLKSGFDASTKIDNQSMSDIAATYGHYTLSNLLVEYGSQKSDKNELIQLEFINFATEFDIVSMERALKNGAKINKKDKNGKYVLVEVLRRMDYTKEHYNTIEFLLENGADPNILSESRLSGMGKVPALYMGVWSSQLALNQNSDEVLPQYKDSPKYAQKTIESLLEAGAYVSGKTEHGKTPLHIAAETNNIVAAKILINYGSKIIPEDNYGNTPLYYAESTEMIKLLKENGAKE